jgi:predicted restriction endonuclease
MKQSNKRLKMKKPSRTTLKRKARKPFKWKTDKMFKCDWCGKEFHRKLSAISRAQRHFCCQNCYTNFQSKTKKGNKLSEEWRKNISEAKMGFKNPMFGKKLSKDHKEKIGIASKKLWNSVEYRTKITKKLRSNGIMRIGTVSKSKKTLRICADALWRRLVLIRANNKCEICGKDKNLNAHHIVSRKNLHLRYDLRNGMALCPSHHFFGKDSAHMNPIWFIDILEKQRPDDLEYLKKEQSVLEPSFDYQIAIERMKKELC